MQATTFFICSSGSWRFFFLFFCSQTNVYKQAVFADVDVVRFFICKHIPELTPDFNPDSQGYVLALQIFSSHKFSYFYKDFQNQHLGEQIAFYKLKTKKQKQRKKKGYNEYMTRMILFSVFIFVFFFFNR